MKKEYLFPNTSVMSVTIVNTICVGSSEPESKQEVSDPTPTPFPVPRAL